MPPDHDEIGSSHRSPHRGYAILSRYALVLDTVAKAGQHGVTLAEIGQQTRLPQATVYRLAHALVHVGFLASGERRRCYVLGSRLLHLICTAIPPDAMQRMSQPVLNDLAAEFGETAFMCRLKTDIVETYLVAHPVGGGHSSVHPGRILPFHAAASAKAILAHAEDDLVRRVLSRSLRRFTSRTKTSKNIICEDLAHIRERGFAVSDEELFPGVLAYACPVHLGSANEPFSLGLVGFRDRFTRWSEDVIVAALKAAADSLTREIRAAGIGERDTSESMHPTAALYADGDRYDWSP